MDRIVAHTGSSRLWALLEHFLGWFQSFRIGTQDKDDYETKRTIVIKKIVVLVVIMMIISYRPYVPQQLLLKPQFRLPLQP